MFHAIEGQFGRVFNFVDYFGHLLQILVSDSKANIPYSVGILLFPTIPLNLSNASKEKKTGKKKIKEKFDYNGNLMYVL